MRENALSIETAFYKSPIGTLKIAATENGIEKVIFCDETKAFLKEATYGVLQDCIQQLDEYFNRKRKHFDLKLNPQGTEFQKRVWAQLQQLSFGKTTNYGAISKNLGDANLMRAVGMANGRNPIAIIIPCHRVIGADGTLTGYAGGLERKKWLLDFESAERQASLF